MLFHWRVKKLLKHLRELNEDVFSCFLSLDYQQATYLFERRIHEQKNKCMMTLLKLSNMTQKEDMLKNTLVEKLKKIFLITIDYSLLRWRVSDPHTFSICKKELENIDQAISELYRSFYKKTTNICLKNLNMQLDSLEDNYQQVLQVSALAPLYFLIFIASLKTLSEVFDDFAQCLS